MSKRNQNTAEKEEAVWSTRQVEIWNIKVPLTVTFKKGVEFSEGSIINSKTVLTIHGKGSIKKGVGHDSLGRCFTIPINCKKKLRVKQLYTSQMFPTVRDICMLEFIPQIITNELEFEVYTVPFPKNTLFEVILVCVDNDNTVVGLSVESFAPDPVCMLLPCDVRGNFKEYMLPYDENRSYFFNELKTRRPPLFVEFDTLPDFASIGHFEPEGICRIEEIKECKVVYATATINNVEQALAIECENICTLGVRQILKGSHYHKPEVDKTELEKLKWFFENICSQGNPSFAPYDQIRTLWGKSWESYKPTVIDNIYSPDPERNDGSIPKICNRLDSDASQYEQEVESRKKVPPQPPKRVSSLKKNETESPTCSMEKVLNEDNVVAKGEDRNTKIFARNSTGEIPMGDCSHEVKGKRLNETSSMDGNNESRQNLKDIQGATTKDRESCEREESAQCNKEPENNRQNEEGCIGLQGAKGIDDDSLSSLLSKLHLEKYKERLLAKQFNMTKLKESLERNVVVEIGMTKFDARKVLLNAKHGWWCEEINEKTSNDCIESWTTADVVEKIDKNINMRQFAEFCIIHCVDGKLLANILDEDMIQSLRDDYKLQISEFEEAKLREFVLHSFRPRASNVNRCEKSFARKNSTLNNS